MLTQILATKLFIPPPRPRVVARPRLFARLDEGLHGKLTLISAPAGFGKTTLVGAWLAGCTCPAAWLSLDAGDGDLTRFLAYLIAALQKIVPELGAGVLADLHSPQPPPSPILLTALLNEMAAIPGDFILVLDDYHTVEAPPVDAALAFLLEHLPPQAHLVMTTREDPQLPLARLRMRGQMTELRAADLRFTPIEAAGFLQEGMNLELSAEAVSALETRTEGWIAGLQLAAISLRGRADAEGFIQAFAGDDRYIVDYLVEEVLQRQPPHVRSFLLQTSLLERLSGPLCNAVTGQDDGAALLDALERANLFVVPLDDKRHWFRYHHLFGGVLAARAHQEQPAQVPLLHQKASAWYAANGWPADAIRHALAAHDFPGAAVLIELAWPAMDGRFQSATWLAWARALPPELVRARPVLSAAYGWALLNAGDLEAAVRPLDVAEQWLAASAAGQAPAAEMVIADTEQFRTLPASLATARAYLTQAGGDIEGSVLYGRRALDLLPPEDYLRRGPAAALLGLAQWASGDLEAAYQTLVTAGVGFRKIGNLHFALSVTYGLGDIRTAQGRLRDAVEVYTRALELALAQGEPFLRGTADLYLGLGALSHEQGERTAASHYLQRSEELGEAGGLSDWRYRMYRVQAHVKAGEGDLTGALALLDAAARQARRTPVPDVRPLGAMQARLWVAQGRLAEALDWVQARRLAVDDELTFLREYEHITLARVLLALAVTPAARPPTDALRPLDDAVRLLARLYQAATAGGRMGSAIETGVLQALAYQAQGDTAAALAVLQRALQAAAPEGYMRIFVDEGQPLAPLLSLAAAQGLVPTYAARLLAALGADTPLAPPQDLAHPDKTQVLPPKLYPPAAVPVQPLIEPLRPRELQILQLIAQGLSNEAIGAQLFLAESTVKGHNRNIFGKLHVQNRTEAVARARALGLL